MTGEELEVKEKEIMRFPEHESRTRSNSYKSPGSFKVAKDGGMLA